MILALKIFSAQIGPNRVKIVYTKMIPPLSKTNLNQQVLSDQRSNLNAQCTAGSSLLRTEQKGSRLCI